MCRQWRLQLDRWVRRRCSPDATPRTSCRWSDRATLPVSSSWRTSWLTSRRMRPAVSRGPSWPPPIRHRASRSTARYSTGAWTNRQSGLARRIPCSSSADVPLLRLTRCGPRSGSPARLRTGTVRHRLERGRQRETRRGARWNRHRAAVRRDGRRPNGRPANPSGGYFQVWQARKHVGAMVVNEPGALCWTELSSRDTKAAKAFYTALFGWTAKDSSADAPMDTRSSRLAGSRRLG